MRDITEEFVNEWYARACDEVRPSALEHAVWLLKRVMRAATERQPDGGPPLLSSNPCNLVTRKRQSKRRDQAPMTKQEIDALVEGFPEYDRLSVHLALLVGGLWTGNGVLDRFLEDESLFGEFLRTPVSEGGVESLVVEPPHIVVEVGA